MEIVQSLYIGGRSVRYSQTVEGLRANGNHVVAVSLSSPDQLFNIDSLIVMPCNARIKWKLVVQLVKLIRRHKIEIIHAHCEKTQLLAGIAGWITKTPIVATVHRSDLSKYLPSRINSLVKLVTTHYVAVSSERLSRLHNQLNIPLRSLTMIHGGVNPRPLPDPKQVQELKHRLNIVAGKCILLSVGHMGEIKGHSDTLDALCDVDKESFHLYIAGTGSDKDVSFIEEKIAKLGLSNQVDLLGHQKDVDSWLDCCDIFVQPSREEAFGLVFIESGLAGKPVVATNIGGIKDIVIDHKTGLLVDVCQSQQLAQAITFLIKDKQTREEMGKSAARYINKNFLVKDMIADYENLFVQVSQTKVSRWKQLLQ